MKSPRRWTLAAIFALVAFLIWRSGLVAHLNLTGLKYYQLRLQQNLTEYPLLFRTTFFLSYVLMSALSIPGATVFTLAGGMLFGLWEGIVLVSFASSLGATLAFLFSRYLFRDAVDLQFRSQLDSINAGLKKDGPLYLLSLRLVPVFPFFIINLLMGLTTMRVGMFYLVSQIGMLPATAVYVNAGLRLSEINSLSGILSAQLFISFSLLGIVPIFSKLVLDYYKKRRVYSRFRRPAKYDYNLVVIGGGAAGLVTSYIAATLKAKVALIEKHKMGGDCLYTGCVPSKAFIKSAKVAHTVRNAEKFGFTSREPEVNFAALMERIQTVIGKIEPNDSPERYSALGVDCLKGDAKVISPFEISLNDRVITSRNIVLATGASPLIPPIGGLDQIDFLTSSTVWKVRELPKRLLILGGGPIACELAQAFGRLGSKVTLVEMMPRLLNREDPVVSTLIAKVFESEGVSVLVSHKAVEFRPAPNATTKAKGGSCICEGPGNQREIPFDAVLVALGRKPNTQGFGLEELGVELNINGSLTHDSFLRTKYPNMFVCGDVAGPYQFTHTAAHQAWFASVNALLAPFVKFKANYKVIPWATYCDPEIARVGVNEIEAKEQALDYELVEYDLKHLDRAIADSEERGFVRVLVRKGSDTILGATLVGSRASDMIGEFVSAMKNGYGLNKILGTIHVYPTYLEANQFAAGLWKQKHKPEGLLKWVERFHRFRR